MHDYLTRSVACPGKDFFTGEKQQYITHTNYKTEDSYYYGAKFRR